MVVYPSTEDCKGKITIKNYESKSYIYLNPDENEVVYFTLRLCNINKTDRIKLVCV